MTPRKLIQRLLAVVLVLAVAVLATGAASHWHARASDELNCQACHVGRAAAVGPAAPSAASYTLAIARLVAPEAVAPVFLSFRAPSIPRAPPA